jgi:hypothetical protein
MAGKEQKKEEQYVMICPKCKSLDVYMDRTNPLQPAMGLPSMYICDKCGHSGNTFPEVLVSEIEEFEEEVKDEDTNIVPNKTQKVDTSYGNFEVRFIWKITAPLLLVLGVIILGKVPLLGAILTLASLFFIYITYFKKRKLKEE